MIEIKRNNFSLNATVRIAVPQMFAKIFPGAATKYPSSRSTECELRHRVDSF
jgi:hypothetical protein